MRVQRASRQLQQAGQRLQIAAVRDVQVNSCNDVLLCMHAHGRVATHPSPGFLVTRQKTCAHPMTECLFVLMLLPAVSLCASVCCLQTAAVLLPGYYAAARTGVEITLARPCPQNYYCPGGTPLGVFNPNNPGSRNVADTTLQSCPDGRWTQQPGATAATDCCKCMFDCGFNQ